MTNQIITEEITAEQDMSTEPKKEITTKLVKLAKRYYQITSEMFVTDKKYNKNKTKKNLQLKKNSQSMLRRLRTKLKELDNAEYDLVMTHVMVVVGEAK